MKGLVGVLLLCTISAAAAGQDRGTIDCQGRTSITAWERPGSIIAVKQLSCDQAVTILGLEREYVKIQMGEQTAYVEAKYVRVPQLPEQQPTQPQAREKEPQQQRGAEPTPIPQAESPTSAPEPERAPAITPQSPEQFHETEEAGPHRHRAGLSFEGTKH
jgi:hypothetical protein